MSDRMKTGDVFRVKYPFIRDTYDEPDEIGFSTVTSWTPGVRFVPCGPIGDDSEGVCDGEGLMVLTVVDVHKPGRFPARVFFTRSWVDPDGNTFGKGALRITTQAAFTRRTKGYMHEYRIEEAKEPA